MGRCMLQQAYSTLCQSSFASIQNRNKNKPLVKSFGNHFPPCWSLWMEKLSSTQNLTAVAIHYLENEVADNHSPFLSPIGVVCLFLRVFCNYLIFVENFLPSYFHQFIFFSNTCVAKNYNGFLSVMIIIIQKGRDGV